MSDANPPVERPLSPHLQIFRPIITMTMSILHRITGAGLYLGSLLLAWWLMAAALGPNAFATAQSFMASAIGRLILLGFTWALMHHMLGGIRHLIWDTGRAFERAEREWLARASLYGAIVLTLALWGLAYLVLGGVR